MRKRVRWQYVKRSPRLLTNLLAGRHDFTFDLMPFHQRGLSWAKRINLLRAGLNLFWRRNRPWSWPIHMQMELTSYCNLRCPVCPTGAGILKRSARAMDLPLLERVTDEVGPYLLTMSLWAWGEPLLHPQLAEALRIVTGRTFGVKLSTNGQNLDDPRVQEALLDHPPTYLIVAIDGLTDATNSRYRVGARLAPALEGVRALAAARRRRGQSEPLLHMRYIVTRHNEHELPGLEDFARRNGFDVLSVRTMSIIDAPEAEHRSLVPEHDEYRAYEYEKGCRVRRDDFVCQTAFNLPAVLADGTVVACDQDFNAQAPLGRLGEGTSFADVWFGRQAQDVRRRIKREPRSLSFCRDCPYADRSSNTCSVRWIDLRQEKTAPVTVG